ncbi:hypothetical protein HDE_11585 [Halotydeus destructor]|nr:hypothetical protein HDE_11585 [Halotydeus destructor]
MLKPNLVHQEASRPAFFIDSPNKCHVIKNVHQDGEQRSRHVDKIRLTPQLELQKFRRQFIVECISLAIITLAIVFTILTPFLLIPVWVIPNDYSWLIRRIMWAGAVLSVSLLVMGALLGNVYWYYDPVKKIWRWFFHCGKGPSDYYWGDLISLSSKQFNVNCDQSRLSVSIA